MRRCAFTLIELLVVLAIVALVFGMIAGSFAQRDLRRQSVEQAAQELAATLRRARALAMERKSTYGVLFNIQNHPQSSGRVLNNRSGGHWYRIQGPPTESFGNSDRNDELQWINSSWNNPPYTIPDFRRLADACWAEDAHVLPPGKVRFLALTDMDYANHVPLWNWRGRGGFAGNPTYPRPWFGYLDTSASPIRLYPWGGYDPAIVASGFYFHGVSNGNAPTVDPTPATCVNTQDRLADQWVTGAWNSIPVATNVEKILVAGEPRPLIDASIRDASIEFKADGTVLWGNWLVMRHNNYMVSADGYKRGLPERCNGIYGNVDQHYQNEAGCFDRSSGGWFITLAPDSLDDKDTFATAKEALASISPMFRVFVSKYGDIKVVPVGTGAKLKGMTPYPPTANWWATFSNVQKYFPTDRLLDGTQTDWSGTAYGNAIGEPITDWVTTETLSKRQIWLR